MPPVMSRVATDARIESFMVTFCIVKGNEIGWRTMMVMYVMREEDRKDEEGREEREERGGCIGALYMLASRAVEKFLQLMQLTASNTKVGNCHFLG